MTSTAVKPRRTARYGLSWESRLVRLGQRIFQARARMSLAEWSEAERRWPNDAPYRISETPHVREVLEAYSDPLIEEITIVKPSQSGLTEGFAVNACGYHIDQDPRAILLVIPSVDEAEKWSKKKLQPMIDASPAVRGTLEDGSRKSSNTMLEKVYPGGSIGIVGSNSGRGFRMVTIATAIGDDVEGWDPTAGKGKNSEGDQVTLIRRRTDRVEDRKMVWISTPRLKGGRIHSLYEEMDRVGEWHVPCPQCGEMQVLRMGAKDSPYGLKWEKRKVDRDYQPQPGEVLRGTTLHLPDTAYYVCEKNGCAIDEKHKGEMEAQGEYLAKDGRPVRADGARKIGLWLRGTLTVTLPGSEWPRVITEFLSVKDFSQKLMAFQNLVLAEFWEQKGSSPEWRRLYDRREDYPTGVCPAGVEWITVGVDVQESWVEYSVWGWGWDKESWLIEHGAIDGKMSDPATRAQLSEVLHREYPKADGSGALPVARLAIDTGFDQTNVVTWAKETGDHRIMLVKGDHWKNWSVIVGTPRKSEVTIRGKKTGLLLWPVGGALIKQETYGFVALNAPLDGEDYPPGYIHVPKGVDREFVQGFLSEDLVTEPDKNGFMQRTWVKNRPRNEPLDCRVYARAAAEAQGIGRMVRPTGPAPTPKPKPRKEAKKKGRDGNWLDRGGRRRGGKGWV